MWTFACLLVWDLSQNSYVAADLLHWGIQQQDASNTMHYLDNFLTFCHQLMPNVKQFEYKAVAKPKRVVRPHESCHTPTGNFDNENCKNVNSLLL